MRAVKAVAAAVACVMLAGCANVGYVMNEYGDKRHETISTPYGTYKVWDRPAKRKIMTAPPLGRVAGDATVSGLTFGIAKTDPTVQEHQVVVRQWFREHGRNCTIKTSTEILRPQYEHTYTCQ